MTGSLSKISDSLQQFTLFILLFIVGVPETHGQTTLPKVFSNNMVLQRERSIPVWGTSKPTTIISVELAGIRAEAIADKNGEWMLRLSSLPAGGPFTMSLYEGNNTIPCQKYNNVLIGDVWLASGQSNMEWQVQQAKNAKTEIQNANYPSIRFLNVPHDKRIEKRKDIRNGSWKVCDTNSVKDISAVAYYFSRMLHTDLNVPIGILQSTWGGTPVEAWTSREQLLSSPILCENILANDTIKEEDFIQDSIDLVRFWDIDYKPQNNADKIIPLLHFDDTKWQEMQMPKTFKDWNWPFYEGIVWMRKTINFPESMQGKDLTINLGHPEMNYSMYFNGTEICKTIWNANPAHYYTIPAELIKKGGNVIAVRLSVLWGGGGFNPPAEEMILTDSLQEISLAGNWKFMKDLEPEIPKINNYHQYPGYLYNAMIHPLVPYGIKGFIWYQGENNVEAASNYQTLFQMLIADWRMRWQQGDIPFIYVQLANYMNTQPEPSESEWAKLREAQAKTLSVPNTGMACIIDIGETNSIHPLNKQEVGRRLALLAEKMVYNKSLQASGPKFQSYTIEGNKIIVHFKETGAGLSKRGKEILKGFAIAGNDHTFYWADALIDGNNIRVSSEKVANPIAVRYGWADNPVCNLINKEGLPAVPFRTDNWVPAVNNQLKKETY